jgi:hypothetical protein
MLRIRTAISSASAAVQRKADQATEFEGVPCGSLKTRAWMRNLAGSGRFAPLPGEPEGEF